MATALGLPEGFELETQPPIQSMGGLPEGFELEAPPPAMVEEQGFMSRVADIAGGTLEVPAALATGAIGGLAGLAGSIATAPFKGGEYAKGVRESTTNLLTYKPQTESGKQAMNILGTVTTPLTWPRKIAESVGGEQWGNVADVAMMGVTPGTIKSVAKMAKEGVSPTIARAAGTAAEDVLGRTAKWSTVLPVGKQRALSQTALKHKLSFTEEGVGKLDKAIDTLDNQLTRELYPIQKNKVRVKNIGDTVRDELRSQVAEDSPTRNADIAAIDGLVTEWEESAGRVAEGEVAGSATIGRLQNMKRKLYKQLKGTYDATGNATIKTDVYKGIARNIKETIENESGKVGRGDRIQKINAEMGDLLELDPHLNRATNRIGNRNYLGLPEYLSAGAGATVGGIPGAAGIALASKVVRSPGMQTKLAQKLYDVSKRFSEPERPMPPPRGPHTELPYEDIYPLYPEEQVFQGALPPGRAPKALPSGPERGLPPGPMAGETWRMGGERTPREYAPAGERVGYPQPSAPIQYETPQVPYPGQRALPPSSIEVTPSGQGVMPRAQEMFAQEGEVLKVFANNNAAKAYQNFTLKKYGIETEIRKTADGKSYLRVTKNPYQETARPLSSLSDKEIIEAIRRSK